eukprot:2230314-Pyramimonas_sp.AAC.2
MGPPQAPTQASPRSWHPGRRRASGGGLSGRTESAGSGGGWHGYHPSLGGIRWPPTGPRSAGISG